MPEFTEPKGINFSSPDELPADELAKYLREIVYFIQRLDPSEKLARFGDWLEHDGLHFYQGKITFDEVLEMVASPESIMETMSGDFNVFVGISPVGGNNWYLRFYADREDDEESAVGRFDVTFPIETAALFEVNVLNQLDLKLNRNNAEDFYRSISC